jgi:integrase
VARLAQPPRAERPDIEPLSADQARVLLAAIAHPPAIVDELAAHRRRQGRERELAAPKWSDAALVFTTRRGTPVDGAGLTRQLHTVLARAGLPDRRWHDLRHWCGSTLAAQGVPLPESQAILGHADPATTAVYLHSLSDSQRAAAQRMQEALFGRNRGL